MKNLDKANEWLQRAKSNMARAKAGRVSPEILYNVFERIGKAGKGIAYQLP